MTSEVQLGIPHITVLETLGRGGFGVVYKGFDSKMNRPVAIKVLTSIIDESDLERFEQEWRLHGPLSSHPNIVTVFDAGYTTSGSPYLVMELIEGGTLADQLKTSGPIPWEQAVQRMVPICRAVQAAHDRGVLHRDIKPSNILLASEGPKLADFGIACVADATSPHFAVSWLHAAPESHDNRRDTRSDVYSLASTLYELVAGRAPFWREDQPLANLMMRLVEEPPPHLSPPVGPRWLDDVLQRALSKNPAERPQSAADLAAALTDPQLVPRGTAPLGFGTPILGMGTAATSQAATRFDPSPAGIRFETAPAGSLSTNPMHSSVGTVSGPMHTSVGTVSGGAGYPSGPHSVVVVERPRRRRGGLLATGAVLAAIGVAGFALTPAGADILAQLTGAHADGTTSTTTPPEAGETSGYDPASTGSGATQPTNAVAGASPTDRSTTDTTAGSSTSDSSGTTNTTANNSTTEHTGGTVAPPETAEVPHLTGVHADEAIAHLEELGFTHLTVAEEPSEDLAAGLVTRTDPVAGATIELDTLLTVYVSTGPEVVEIDIPDTLGLTRDDAIAELEAAGFVVNAQFKVLEEGSPNIGKVISQTPASGSAEAGSEVTILVGRAPLELSNPSITFDTVKALPGASGLGTGS